MTRIDMKKHEQGASQLGRIAQVLDGSVDAAENTAGRERLLMELGARHARPKLRLSTAAAAAVLLGAVFVGRFIWMNRADPVEYRISGSSLKVQGEWLEAEEGPGKLCFSEGTEFDLARGGEIRVAERTPDGAHVFLRSGELRARVFPRRHSRWQVSAGPYVVEVIGTVFNVDWSDRDQRLELRLHKGEVRVRGPHLQDGIRVTAGQKLVVYAKTGKVELSSLVPDKTTDDPRETSESRRSITSEQPQTDRPPTANFSRSAPSRKNRLNDGSSHSRSVYNRSRARREEAQLELPPPTDTEDESASETPSDPPQKEDTSHSAPSWTNLLASGDFHAVLSEARARGIETTLQHAPLRDIVALADAARYSGDRALARRALLVQRARFASSTEAHTAAFLLGCIADDAGASSEALRWYEVYLRRSLRGEFSAEALGRKLDIVVRSGDHKNAVMLAEQYLELFPRGAHADYARDVLQSP